MNPLYAFTAEDEVKLGHLEPLLVKVVRAVMARQVLNFKVLQTLRTVAEETTAVATGHSATMHSKHLADPAGFARAVDLCPVPVDFKDTKRYGVLAGLMIAEAQDLGVTMRWGGNWNGDNNFHDNKPEDPGHFELN